MASNEIRYNDMSVTDVLTTLDKQGIKGTDANTIVAGWILENVYKTKQVFNYKETFVSSIPGCMPGPFVRKFVHQNWVDGEDLVQAGDANGKDGFNSRFHKIEQDLDELGNEIHTLAQCVADMRAMLASMLGEIRTEINNIYSQLPGTDVVGPIRQYPHYAYELDTTPQYLGTSKILGKNMTMWQTKEGIMTLPTVGDPPLNTGPGRTATYPGLLVQYMKDNPAYKQTFPAAVDVDTMRQKLGTNEIAPGITVNDALAIMPAGTKFATADALAADVTDRTSLALSFTGHTDAIKANLAGLTSIDKSTASIGLESLTNISSDQRTALTAGGIKTAADLAAADPIKIGAILKTGGVTTTDGTAASLVTNAKLLDRLNIRG